MPRLRDFFLGRPQEFEKVQRFDEPQQAGIAQALQQALSGLKDPQAGFAPIAQQARTQFQEQTIPSILEQLTGGGGQDSSALAQMLGQAGAGLEQGLASQQAQFGQQQQGLFQQLLGQGLTPQFDIANIQQDPGLLRQLFSALAGGVGQGIGSGFNPFSALKGLFQGGGQGAQQQAAPAPQPQTTQGVAPPQQSVAPQAGPVFSPQQFGSISGIPGGGVGGLGSTAGNLGFLLRGGF